MNFTNAEEDLIEDVLGQRIELCSAEEKAELRKWLNERKAPRSKLSQEALTARETAKLQGCKTLTGTKKQKEWAEKIRAEKLANLTRSNKEQLISMLTSEHFSTAKFWIETRDIRAIDIAEKAQVIFDLITKANQLNNDAMQFFSIDKNNIVTYSNKEAYQDMMQQREEILNKIHKIKNGDLN